MLFALVTLLAVLVVAGIVLWAIQQFPLDANIARMIRVVVIVAVALYAIVVLFGLVTGHRLFAN